MVVGMVGADSFAHENAVMTEMGEMGGKTLALVPGKSSAGQVTVYLPDNLPAWTMPVLYLPVVQSMAHARAMAKGLDPDNPRNLSAVVFLDRASLR